MSYDMNLSNEKRGRKLREQKKTNQTMNRWNTLVIQRKIEHFLIIFTFDSKIFNSVENYRKIGENHRKFKK